MVELSESKLTATIEDFFTETKLQMMGIQSKGYAGAFPPKVEEIIRRTVLSPCLHLFSGTSDIGDLRIDAERPEANLKIDVFKFITEDKRDWEFVVADPPYSIKHTSVLNQYAITEAVSGTILYQKLFNRFLQAHARNVLWFDFCSPCPKGFYRFKTWLWAPGGFSWFHVRVLTWLKREGEYLQ